MAATSVQPNAACSFRVNAAHATAYALEAAGASVDLRSPVARSELSGDALRGGRVMVRVEDGGREEEPLRLLSGPGTARRTGLSDIAKVGIIVVMLLMLFGAELRLRFGLRLDTIVTVAGIWAFWYFCLRPRAVSAQ
jgi:hypothetical protein